MGRLATSFDVGEDVEVETCFLFITVISSLQLLAHLSQRLYTIVVKNFSEYLPFSPEPQCQIQSNLNTRHPYVKGI